MKNYNVLLVLLLFYITTAHHLIAQSREVKKYLKEEEEKLKREFPEPLLEQYPKGSLGEKIQTLYKLQAETSCGISRTDERLYIPKEIVSGYGHSKLKSTMIYDIPISATNLLFFALTPNDIDKLKNGNLVETEYVNAKRVVGQNDNLVNYGQSVLAPIAGFPSLFYQKSCGSYFVGDLNTEIKAPVAELKASLSAETKKSSSITTITGKFFSPLYLIFRQNTVQSVYAHLLLWEIYQEQYKNTKNGQDLLVNNGKYISEFNATLTNRATDSEQSLNMNGRLSANISAGIFSSNGNIQAGFDNKISFSLKDFNTSIHKLSNGELSYALTNLPKTKDINQKLQNSLNFKAQPPFNSFVTHLLPTEISRVLTGVPTYLCDRNSWIIEEGGYNTNIWRDKPIVTSNSVEKEGEYPECVCKISGYLNKSTIDQAIADKGTLEIKILLTNILQIGQNKIAIDIFEPSVKVTDAPKILTINSEVVNAGREEVRSSSKISYHYPVQFLIDATGVKLTEPYKISNLQIEYVNKDQIGILNNSLTNLVINGNAINVEITTQEKPKDYIQVGDFSVPVKLKFSIELLGGAITQLATNTINLTVPNLVKKVEVETKVDVQPSTTKN